MLVGTFALAVAFAGNDLVNFIGVPLAGFDAFKIFHTQAGGVHASEFSMSGLRGEVSTPTTFLIIAGLIMVITLWLSKKARSVVRTSLNLSNQEEIYERFSSSMFARTLVRQWLAIGNAIRFVLPNSLVKAINKRFNDKYFRKHAKKEKGLSFDLVRASVNLVVSSILIAYATSYKLPLSTTYVTFMVAMGTSLSDRAWGRESAVYRISGVIAVIGGWFFTAFSAFTVAFLIALFINWLSYIAIFILVLVAGFFVYKTHAIHKKREEKITKDEESGLDADLTGKTIYERCSTVVISSLLLISEVYVIIINGFIGEKRKKLQKANKEVKKLNAEIKSLKRNVHSTVKKIQEEESVESGDYYVQLLDYLREAAHCMTYIAQPVYDHVDNNHAPLHKTQSDDLISFLKIFTSLYKNVIQIITSAKFRETEKIITEAQEVLAELAKMRKTHLKRIKSDSIGTRVSMLYLDILSETKNLVLHTINLLKSSRDFTQHNMSGLNKII